MDECDISAVFFLMTSWIPLKLSIDGKVPSPAVHIVGSFILAQSH